MSFVLMIIFAILLWMNPGYGQAIVLAALFSIIDLELSKCMKHR